MQESLYLGRFQQGSEVPLVLQCTDASGTPDDPTGSPKAQVYLDGSSVALVQTITMPADLRGVETGLFRMPLFLNALYATAGRYVVVYKWNDSDGIAHTRIDTFHILPGGDADGSVIGMHFSNRPDATYLIFQGDSGRLLRKANPR